jgi:hypothetical protein
MPPCSLVRKYNVNGWPVDLVLARCNHRDRDGNLTGCPNTAEVEVPVNNAPFSARLPQDATEREEWENYSNFLRSFLATDFLCELHLPKERL